ncbi:TPA: polysaccharide biosynthesis protein [Vibrio cholerae]|nr:polysaccharide biosynthesis protein [Vibrio cholerae]HEQ3579724.1 polysaccharide biosynthesis protein [Vibrio cholerae]
MNIVFIAGEGGHAAQFKRFLMKSGLTNKFMVLTDEGNSSFKGFPVICSGSIRGKFGFTLKDFVFYFYRFIFKIMPRLIYEGDCIISFGPGVAIMPAVIFKLLGRKVIHIETWSRFKSKSMTGKFMYYIADVFYVQNESLLKVYPKAIFSGRL